jgi:hypothetical protein
VTRASRKAQSLSADTSLMEEYGSVQELIDLLEMIENKQAIVSLGYGREQKPWNGRLGVEYGRCGCGGGDDCEVAVYLEPEQAT